MKLQRILLILLVLSVVILASCANGPRVLPRAQTTNYFQGTDALTLEYVDQAPPKETFEGSEFDVQLILHNEGAFDLLDPYKAKLTMIYDTDKVTEISAASRTANAYIDKEDIQLEGKSADFPKGEQDFFAVDRFEANEIYGRFQESTASFITQLCYPYKTFFAEEFCIDTDTTGTNLREEVCQATDRKFGGGQGAPVTITAVDTQMVPRGVYVQPQFTIYIENKGEGTTSFWDDSKTYSTDLCGVTDRTRLNKLHADVRLGDDVLDCLPSEIILRGGEGKIQCQLTEDKILGVAANYQTSLIVELSYLYTETYREDVTIQLNEGDPFDNFQETEEENCFAWETLDPSQNKCLNTCEYKAVYDQDLPAFDSLEESMEEFVSPELTKEFFWESVGCHYRSTKDCRDNPRLCVLENNFCTPGHFCGLPECVFDNTQPRILDISRVGADRMTFTCKDDDDAFNVDARMCGCTPNILYGFAENKEDCDVEETYTFSSLGEEVDSSGFIHYISGLSDESLEGQFLCIQASDRLGLKDVQALKYPWN